MVDPKTRWPVQVRMSDLGEDQRVMPHRVLEWCQDAATWASSAAGYTTERYIEMGAAWYIRSIVLQVPGTLIFDDRVEIETWVSSLRRFRTERCYVVYAGGEVRARAQAEWMFLKFNPDKGVRPYHLDEAMQAAFPIVSEVAVDAATVPEWRPELAPAHRMQRTAHASEIDRYRHLNHVHYAAWVVDHCREAGLSAGRVNQIRLHYQADIKPGQTIELELEPTTALDAVGAQHRLMRSGKPVARAITRFEPASG